MKTRERKPAPGAYEAAYREAVLKARQLQMDVGIELNKLFGTYHVFLLPTPQNRCGHELRCEVVTPTSPTVK